MTPTSQQTFQPSPVNAYAEHDISYDLNGNITALQRTDGMGAHTAQFQYEYGQNSNRLMKIHTATGGDWYEYNEIGETVHQQIAEKDRYLTYDASGKVTGVYHDAAHEQPLVTYTHDDRGFRASQTVRRDITDERSEEPGDEPPKARILPTHLATLTTHYVRDAAGNVLSVYEQVDGGPLQQTETPLYAASRVGTRLRQTADEADQNPDNPDLGFDQHYELTDHLGSARVVFHRPTVRTTQTGLELTNAPTDEQHFDHLPDCRTRLPALARTGEYVAWLDLLHGPGPATDVAVQAGDSVTLSAWAFFPPSGVVHRAAASLLLNTAAPTAAGAVLAAAPTPPRPPAEGGAPPKTSALGQVLRRLSVGLGIGLGPGGGGSGPSQTRVPTPVASLFWVLKDGNGNDAGKGEVLVPDAAALGWQRVALPVKLAQAGTLHLEVVGGSSPVPVLFDDVVVRHRGGLIVQEQHQYPYGAPLTGLNYVVGTRRYRHGYQGQYAEVDTTTGWESFELRLYDATRARWSAPDPEGQYASPYVAMGNNPVTGVDLDGGWASLIEDGAKAAGKGVKILHQNTWVYHAGKGAGVAASAARAGSSALRTGLSIASTIGHSISTFTSRYDMAFDVELSVGPQLALDLGVGSIDASLGALKYGEIHGQYNTQDGFFDVLSRSFTTEVNHGTGDVTYDGMSEVDSHLGGSILGAGAEIVYNQPVRYYPKYGTTGTKPGSAYGKLSYGLRNKPTGGKPVLSTGVTWSGSSEQRFAGGARSKDTRGKASSASGFSFSYGAKAVFGFQIICRVSPHK